MATGTGAMFAPCIFEDLLLCVQSLFYVRVSVETIMQRHNESVEKQGGPSNCDDLLTHRFVRRQERVIRCSIYELDADNAISISMWVENISHVFFYEDFSDVDPFTSGIQTEWQLQQMICFGNRSLIASDSRDVFQCSVLISFWRVRHAWHKNLVKKCVDNEMRATMSRRLHQAMDNICQQRGT
ncbi:uncharacterized protein [Malus domestica]|uniref:uncharacterized protein n=1 Tax=Malus domestica TaxID=3750 RepID=UPI0039763E07